MKDLLQGGTEVKVQWTRDHAETAGNEIADRLAKEAAREAEDMPEGDGETSQTKIKQGAREAMTIKWQRRWQISEKGRVLYQIKSR